MKPKKNLQETIAILTATKRKKVLKKLLFQEYAGYLLRERCDAQDALYTASAEYNLDAGNQEVESWFYEVLDSFTPQAIA